MREIRDRSVLRLFESNEVAAPQALPGGAGVPQPLPSNGGHWDQDQVCVVSVDAINFSIVFTTGRINFVLSELLQRTGIRFGLPAPARSQKQSEYRFRLLPFAILVYYLYAKTIHINIYTVHVSGLEMEMEEHFGDGVE